MVAAKIDPDDLEVTKYFVAAAASTETREQPFAMVKDPDVTDGVFLVGRQDGDFGDATAEIEPDPDSDDDGSKFIDIPSVSAVNYKSSSW